VLAAEERAEAVVPAAVVVSLPNLHSTRRGRRILARR
jgi:hypothetical protein